MFGEYFRYLFLQGHQATLGMLLATIEIAIQELEDEFSGIGVLRDRIARAVKVPANSMHRTEELWFATRKKEEIVEESEG